MHNLIVRAVTALIPLLVGACWYHPKVFGTAWMKATGVTPDSGKSPNMPLIYGLTYLMGLILTMALGVNVIHQYHLLSVTVPEPGTQNPPAVNQWLHSGWEMVGHSYRRYRHGALHGTLFGIFALLPVITVNSLFERRGFKYIAITGGYWIVCCLLMGAVLCHWLIVELHQAM